MPKSNPQTPELKPSSAADSDYIPLESARAFAVLKEALSNDPKLKGLLGLLEGIRLGFRVVGAERLKLREDNAKLRIELKIHKKSSAKLATRAVIEKTEKDITCSKEFRTKVTAKNRGDPPEYPRHEILKWGLYNIPKLRDDVEKAINGQQNRLYVDINWYKDMYKYQSERIHNYLDDCCRDRKIILDQEVQTYCPSHGDWGALDYLKGLADYHNLTIIPLE